MPTIESGTASAGNDRGAGAAQEEKDHHDDEGDRQNERKLHVVHRRADCGGAVGENLHLNRAGKRRLQLRQQRLDAIDDGDDVRAGLALNVQDDGGMLVGPGGLLGVFGAVENGGDIAEAHRRAVAIGDDERAIAVAGQKLIVRADREGLMRAVEIPFRLIDVGLAQREAQILKTQSVRSELRRIRLNPHGRPLAAADADHADAGELRNFLRERRLGEIFDLVQRQARRSQRKRHDRRVGRIDLAVDRRIRQILRQQIRRRVDRRLHFLLGDVDVEIEDELQRDDRAAKRARRRHLVQAGDLAELALERRRHRRRHHVRAGARIKRQHLNCRVIDLRQR